MWYNESVFAWRDLVKAKLSIKPNTKLNLAMSREKCCKHWKINRCREIGPMLNARLIEMTIPDKPNSRAQVSTEIVMHTGITILGKTTDDNIFEGELL